MQEDEPEVIVATKPIHKEYTIGGVKVKVPVKPYPSQLAMMDKIIRGLRNRQNCLLESPTGSGKSLAILCSSLAWQQQQIAIARKYNNMIDNGITDPDVLARASGLTTLTPRPMPGAPHNTPTSVPSSHPADASEHLASGAGFFFEDDFQSQDMPVSEFEVTEAELALRGLQAMENMWRQRRPKRLRVPKIFIGTRTHKQVEQLVKELRRTYYSDKVKMVVLSSREHTCIHPIVSNSSNKNEKCKELTHDFKEISCPYYHGRIKTYEALAHRGGLSGAWDIEDLVKVGHKLKSCPYYTARGLFERAELVICPYNYLVDPLIRKAMSISLKNHVLLVDEAHNIEDSAREAASCSITQIDMMEAYKDLKEQTKNLESCEKLAEMLATLSSWIDDKKPEIQAVNSDLSTKPFRGLTIVAALEHMNIGRERSIELARCFSSLLDESPEEEDKMVFTTVTKTVFEQFFLMFELLFKDNLKYADDYRIVLVKEQVRKKFPKKESGWISSKTGFEFQYSLKFWCQNPAVIFSPLCNEAHSVILTSGTLSPMTSFQSELGVSFKIQFEANHVIDRNQVFIGTVGNGPRGTSLSANHKNSDLWEFQDEIGELVLKVCQTVPGGILCFLSSYSLLTKLQERWQTTGLWDEIAKVKVALTEQRSTEAFERDMTNFYATIRNSQRERDDTGEIDTTTGAFFMAVYRGKVSEGLDLTDDNARAVIAVGIPYPAVRDLQVTLKREYNDELQRSRKLLSGREWYEIQAYRAVNQALGRCIRHRYDWGALLLVDSRYHEGGQNPQGNKYIRGLSKWVKQNIRWVPNFSEVTYSLQEFVKNMMSNPPQPPIKNDETLCTSSESSEKEKVQISSTGKDDVPSHNAIPSLQSETIRHNPDVEIVKIIQDTNQNKMHHDKECEALETREKKSIHLENPSFENMDCKPNQESHKISIETKKRLLHSMDFQDLDDFNLALSPAASASSQPSIYREKRIRKKKDLD